MDKKTVFIFSLLMVVSMPYSDSPAEPVYTVSKLQHPVEINAVWDKAPWNTIEALTLRHYMGDKPDHFPVVYAKVAYDDQAIYVIFKVEDQYVIATAEDYLGQVWRDSCVEFFFTPDEDSNKGYFNFEMNCGGTVYFQFQTSPGVNTVQIAESDFQKITIAHTMPKIVRPEIKEPTIWIVEYRMPFSILNTYFDITKPVPGVTWRANFNKCADQCSFPHWLTWAKIDHPKPAFHKPQYFGVLEFGDGSKVDSRKSVTPASLELKGNYPNPFNPKTTIHYRLAGSSCVTLGVYNIHGGLVRTLYNGYCIRGDYKMNFDGAGLSTGIYLVRLTNGGEILTKRMVLVK